MAHQSHTILLLKEKSAQIYQDFDSVSKTIEHLISMYEIRLKVMNPTFAQIDYNVQDLIVYIDSFADVALLCADSRSNCYVPYPREWIKERVVDHIRQTANE